MRRTHPDPAELRSPAGCVSLPLNPGGLRATGAGAVPTLGRLWQGLAPVDVGGLPGDVAIIHLDLHRAPAIEAWWRRCRTDKEPNNVTTWILPGQLGRVLLLQVAGLRPRRCAFRLAFDLDADRVLLDAMADRGWLGLAIEPPPADAAYWPLVLVQIPAPGDLRLALDDDIATGPTPASAAPHPQGA